MRLMGKAAVVAAMVLFLWGGSAAAVDEALPAEQVIAAIQKAVASNPGLVKEVEVEREEGRLIVEVEIVGTDGRKSKVKIDPERNERLN
jgi:uncharacterized membrane protein YkoI